MRLIEGDQLEVRQKFVVIALFREPRLERLDRRDDDMEIARRPRSRLSVPHPGDTKTRRLTADARPHLSPCFHGLLAQLVSVRYPKDTATEAVIAHGFNNRLHRDARLAPTRSAC